MADLWRNGKEAARFNVDYTREDGTQKRLVFACFVEKKWILIKRQEISDTGYIFTNENWKRWNKAKFKTGIPASRKVELMEKIVKSIAVNNNGEYKRVYR